MRRLHAFALITLVEWTLCVALTHELLRQFMTARGVMPWRLSDTLANAFFLVFGTLVALLGANVVLVDASDRFGGRAHVTGIVLLIVGAIAAVGGALSLRKLY